MHTITNKKLLMLKPSQIKIPISRPRKNIERSSLKLLTDSISANGVITPISVRKNKEGFYELISGQLRLRAAVMVGLRRVPCIVYSTDNTESLVYCLTENLQRNPLDPFDEAAALNRLITVCGLTRTQTALRVGITQAELSYKLQLLELESDLTEQLHIKGYGEEYARLLLLLPEYQRKDAFSVISEENMSIGEAEIFIEEKLNPKECEEKVQEETPKEEIRPKPVRKHAIADTRLFANSLSKLTDTLKSAGISVTLRRNENDKYIEYKVRIKKEQGEDSEFKQLKIC